MHFSGELKPRDWLCNGEYCGVTRLAFIQVLQKKYCGDVESDRRRDYNGGKWDLTLVCLG